MLILILKCLENEFYSWQLCFYIFYILENQLSLQLVSNQLKMVKKLNKFFPLIQCLLQKTSQSTAN